MFSSFDVIVCIKGRVDGIFFFSSFRDRSYEQVLNIGSEKAELMESIKRNESGALGRRRLLERVYIATVGVSPRENE